MYFMQHVIGRIYYCGASLSVFLELTMCERNCKVRTPTTKTEATKQKHNCRVRTPKAAKTEATKQKQHTTHDYSIYSSVAISVHCCVHWRSHRHLALVFAPYIYPAILHRCSHLAFFLCAFPMVAQARFSSLCVPFELK